ncbi:MAG TPA: sigma-70 family RNA polymerase sigma factor [Pseudonocardia sp.]|nr:sigma-70 family RNA polymerase sigma factor [Pseudonocardia sp.]
MSALVQHRADSDDGNPAAAPGDTDVALADGVESAPAADSDLALGAAGRSDAGDPDDDPPHDGPAHDDPAAEADPLPAPVPLRIDFGAHFEDNYRRLVAQLYAITLDAGLAHDAVQEAYARAWRRWTSLGSSPDATAWIRGVAVRSTIRSWRSVFGRFGVGRRRPDREVGEPHTAALLSALRRLPGAERRALVLTYMAGTSLEEIAAVEQVSVNTVQARLSRGRRLITENLADDLPALLGPYPADLGSVMDSGEEFR